MEENKSLRQIYIDKRKALSDDDRHELSNKASENLIALLNTEFKGANIFLCFYPLEYEIDLRPFYSNLIESGKTLYFPVSDDRDKTLSFYRVDNLESDFSRGTYQVMEPVDRVDELEDFSDCVCITPGLIFDDDFNRVGYGAGYYDRFFNDNPEITKVGAFFDCQAYPALSPAAHDVKMDYIVTENGYTKRG